MQPNCTICGEPMPLGEEMFQYHGYSGNCPKPPLSKPVAAAPETALERDRLKKQNVALLEALGDLICVCEEEVKPFAASSDFRKRLESHIRVARALIAGTEDK